MNAIYVENLSKVYRTRIKEEGLQASFKALVKPVYKEVQAVNDISFTVEQGEILAFIGPNGAGKSTTIKMLTGILHPTSGRVSVLGLDPVRQRRELSYRIGTVFGQKSQLWFHLPPIDSFVLLGAIYDVDKKTLNKRIAELTELFELGELLQTPVRKLSLGQRIRCEVAASLLHEPDILFLDEPTIGLDVVIKQSIRQLILRMNRERGTTIFLTSHDTGDVERICKRAIIIDQGRIILDQPVKRLKYDYLNRKIIAVRFEFPQHLEVPEGVKLEKSTDISARLSVDTRICSIDGVMRWLIAQGGVADITVEDPPMEEVIASIFQQKEGKKPMKAVGKYITVLRISLQNAFVYRSNVLGGFVFYIMFMFVFFNLWRAIYKSGEVAGYSLVQMVWYLCMTELIMFGCRTGVFFQMNEDVKSGSIAYQLNRPYHYVLYQFFNALGGMIFNLLLYGLMAIVIGMIMVGPIPGFSFSTLPLSLISIVLGMCINFFFLMALGLTAFRLEDNTAFYLIYQKLVFMLGMFIPVEFLPGWLQTITRYLPFSYMTWAPARLIVAFSWELFWAVVPVQLLWLTVSFVLTMGMYRYGVAGIQAHGG